VPRFDFPRVAPPCFGISRPNSRRRMRNEIIARGYNSSYNSIEETLKIARRSCRVIGKTRSSGERLRSSSILLPSGSAASPPLSLPSLHPLSTGITCIIRRNRDCLLALNGPRSPISGVPHCRQFISPPFPPPPSPLLISSSCSSSRGHRKRL